MHKQITQLFLIVLLTCSCGNLFYFGSKQGFYDPKKFGIDYKDVWIQTKDSIKIHGWLLEHSGKEAPRGSVLFFHGNAENISTHFFNLAWMTKHGYEVLIVDYRGYGRSEGEPDQHGTYLDALASFDEIHKISKASNNSKIIVYCQSLGGVICTRALVDWPQKNEVDLLVLDSTFSSYKDIAYDKLKEFWLTYFLSPLSQFLISDKMASRELISNIKNRTLVYHSKNDQIIPYKFGEEIFDLLQAEKQFITLENEGHIQTFKTKERREEFLKILETI